ncbi:MAG: hypothetical protein ACAH83_01380 [Alphaproteobacteria bacterium]
MNKLIISVVVALLAAFIAISRPGPAPAPSSDDPCRMDNDHPPFSCFDQCYDEYATVPRWVSFFLPPAQDSAGLPRGWHMQLNVFLNSRQQSPKDLPADIMALPDLSGLKDIPNLRVVTARNDDLFIALKKLQQRGRLETSDAGVRDEVRNILFMWVGIHAVDPASRGLFIDARELVFLEKITGEKFVQTNNFTNPFPIAATAVKEIFSQTLDYYTNALSRQIEGRAASERPAKFDLNWEFHYDQQRTFLQWTDYKGKKFWFHGYYRPDMMKRKVCYTYLKE